MPTIIDTIVERKKVALEKAMLKTPLERLKDAAIERKATHSFLQALTGRAGMHIIAEIKKSSPSAGLISSDFNPVEIARQYAACGASAISVLTEESYFHGSLEYLKMAKSASNLPILRKDFLTDPYQIYEARINDADAVLLIASLLNVAQMSSMIASADELGMDCLVEVHNKEELQSALLTPAKIIGINNRDLATFKVNLDTAKVLSKLIPKDKVMVVESGIYTRTDIQMYLDNDINCFLIGEVFMRSKDICAKFKEITTPPSPNLSRKGRGEVE
jgi:indole-3-glycerol phosphate synthase